MDHFNDSATHHYAQVGYVGVVCRTVQLEHSVSIFRGFGSVDFSFSYILLDLALFLVLTQVMRYLLKPFHQPRVVTDMIAGLLIGPSVLGRSAVFRNRVITDTSEYLIRNLGVVGFMYFCFILSVKMDMTLVQKAGKKQWTIALAGVIIPHILVFGVAFGIRPYMDKETAKIATFGGIGSTAVITTFPVIYSVLRDLNLLGSEMGRLALSTVVISDIIGLNALIGFEAAKQAESRGINALYYTLTVILVSGIFINGLPKVMIWINDNTPDGEPVNPHYVNLILLGVFFIGFVTDFIGAGIANGPIWLGLAIPDRPPLGAAIVQKSETIMTHFLLPFTYASIGLFTNVHELNDCWSCLGPIFVITLAGYFSKFATVLVVSQYFMPLEDGLTLSLMMSMRGQVDLLLYIHWLDWGMINTQAFAMMVLLTIANTGISTPLIGFFYDPTRPYAITKRRTFQHNQPNSNLRIVACLYDQDCVNSLFSLLDNSNPSPSDPFSVLGLHLIELHGRAAPVFIDHAVHEECWDANDEAILNALKVYEEPRAQYMSVQFFTSIAAKGTMYQDICELALVQKATLIILPFHKKSMVALSSPGAILPGVQSVNSDCLHHAPCSVGILVCKGSLQPTILNHSSPIIHSEPRHFAMLFLGGPDAREALTYADRAAGDPNTYLSVVRFLSPDCEDDNRMETKLDDGVVTWFWMKNERNDRITYREVVVNNGVDTITAIHGMNRDDSYDMWIVGRKNGINPVLLQGLSDWSENPELGTVGDFLASMDFSRRASVLVIQQQVLRKRRGGRVTSSYRRLACSGSRLLHLKSSRPDC